MRLAEQAELTKQKKRKETDAPLAMKEEERAIQTDDDLNDLQRISIRESVRLEKLTDAALFNNRLDEAENDLRITVA